MTNAWLYDIFKSANALGITQKELALRSGISQVTISRLKKQKGGNIDTLCRLAKVVNLGLRFSPIKNKKFMMVIFYHEDISWCYLYTKKHSPIKVADIVINEEMTIVAYSKSYTGDVISLLRLRSMLIPLSDYWQILNGCIFLPIMNAQSPAFTIDKNERSCS